MEAGQGIGDDDPCGVQPDGQLHRSVDEDGGRPGPDRVGDVRMPVGALAAKGDEEVAGLDAPRVDAGAGEGGGRGDGLESAAHGGQKLVDADGRRHEDHAADSARVYQRHGCATGSMGRSGGMAR